MINPPEDPPPILPAEKPPGDKAPVEDTFDEDESFSL